MQPVILPGEDFFLNDKQKKLKQKSLEEKDIKPSYFSITKATKHFGNFLQQQELTFVAPIFAMTGSTYQGKDFNGTEGAVLNKRLEAVLIKSVKAGYKQIYTPEEVFGNKKVYITINANNKTKYTLDNKDAFIHVGDYKHFKNYGKDIEYFEYVIKNTSR